MSQPIIERDQEREYYDYIHLLLDALPPHISVPVE